MLGDNIALPFKKLDSAGRPIASNFAASVTVIPLGNNSSLILKPGCFTIMSSSLFKGLSNAFLCIFCNTNDTSILCSVTQYKLTLRN